MKKTLTFGAIEENLNILKEKLELIFKIKFAIHSDVDDQDYFFYGDLANEHFEISSNYNEAYKHWVIPQHTSYKTLFSIIDTIRGKELQKLLAEEIPELVLLEEFEE